MNRRRFIELLAKTAAVSMVAYSFPSVIKPQNISTAELVYFSHPIGKPFSNWGYYLPEWAVEYITLPRFDLKHRIGRLSI